MNRFDYVRPTTLTEAVTAAAAPGAAYLASGTNLLDLMKGGIVRPSRLVDVSRLPGLDRIERLPNGDLRIGALVRNADLAHDSDFAQTYPAIAEALLSGAFAGLNLRVVRGKSVAFEKLCLSRTERLALMVWCGLLISAHADVSSFQFHRGVRHPLIVQQ